MQIVNASLLQTLQQILSLGIRPDSFTLEAMLAQSLPGGKREGAPGTLVDVISDYGAKELKSTGSIDLLVRKPKDTTSAVYLPTKKLWARWKKEPMVIFRRPNFSHFDEDDAHRGIQANVDRARKFYEDSLSRHSLTEIRSLLVQHSFNPDRNFTVFRFSEGPFYLPEFSYAEKSEKGLSGYSKEGNALYLHNSFTKGSQNFSKVYQTSDADILVCIEHNSVKPLNVAWRDLNGVEFLS
jgi:hypothetical protein